MSFELLKIEVEKGLGNNRNFIPIGLDRLGRYANIRKRILTLLFSSTGAGKCFTPGTKVLMFNGEFKQIENIQIGDIVMGIDSTPRTVTHTHEGYDEMYRIIQNKGNPYIVNKEHILALRKRRKKKNEFLEISVKEAIKMKKSFFHDWKGYKKGVDFKESSVTIDPYFLGLWIGDGTSCKTQITTNDKEIVDYLNKFSKNNNLKIKKYSSNKYTYDFIADKLLKRTLKNGSVEFYNSIEEAANKTNGVAKYISNVVRGLYKNYNNSNWEWVVKDNSLLKFLTDNNLQCNKYIPKNFLINSRENRLKLLAGLLDSDGHYQKDKNGYEITQKSKEISNQIAFLSRSLGFYTSINEKTAVLKRRNKEVYKCKVYRIFIFGENLGEIPCILPRKKAKNTINKNIDPLSTGIRIESVGMGKYHGFSLDGDGLFLLEDFTVAHNSSLLDTMILNACNDYMQSPNGKLRPDFQLFSMERSKLLRMAKWTIFLIFRNEGEIIELPKLLGWWDDKLTSAQKSLFLSYEKYVNELLNDYVTVHEGAKTPNEIYRIMKDHFENYGEYDEIETIDEKTGYKKRTKVYIPKDEKRVFVPALDHGNLIKTTQALPTKKQAIDKTVEYVQGFRDLEGSAPIWVSQINRSIASVSRVKDNEHELLLEDIKESGDIGDACDIAISLFNPAKYNQSSKTGYNPIDFIDKSTGENYFRSLQILKSSYGADDLRIPMAFNGFCGQFKELPKKKDLSDGDYQNLINKIMNKEYFLT